MKTVYSVSIILLTGLFSISGFSQTVTPTPPVNDDKDVVKISTTLIQVDATVTDKKGNVVKDLKPEDFEIYENGKKQIITNFSFVSTAPEDNPTEADKTSKSKDKPAIPLPPFKLKADQIRHTYALVVDDLGLSFANADYVKSTLKKFVNEQMQEGDLVAVLRVGAGLGALQSFTSDKRLLLAAIGKIRWNMMSRTGINSYEPLNPEFAQQLANLKGGSTALSNQAERDAQATAERDLARQSNIATGTLGALNTVIRGMSELPGRKSILFFSEGFQLIDRGRGAPRPTNVLDALRNVAEQANRASVVIYSLDPRGIEVPMIEAQDDTSGIGKVGGMINTGPAIDARISAMRDSKDSLRYLADETGGFAYVLNRLDLGVKKVLNDQSGYYLIGYQPDEETFDPKKSKFNKLTVKLSQPDLKIRYRSGFYGITDENMNKAIQTPVQQMNAALVSPFGATGVNLDLYSIFYNNEKNKNFIRSLIKIDAKDLTFTETPDGKHKTNIQIIAMTFGDNGAPVDQTAFTFELPLDEKNYRSALEKGLVYDFLCPIKKPGAYQFRIVLRDSSSGKIGSASQFVEVPNIDKKYLALSNIIVKNYSVADWKKVSTGQSDEIQNNTAFLDTTARQFNRGTILAYSYMIYNAKMDVAQKTQLQVQKRVFRDGKIIWQTDPTPLGTGEQKDMQRIGASGAISLENSWTAGDYILQIIVIDGLAKETKQITAQSIDFEIVN